MKNLNKILAATLVLTTVLSPLSVSATTTPAVEMGKADPFWNNELRIETAKQQLQTLILNGNTALSNVKSNLTLPLKGEDGLKVTWTSSNPEVVGTDGTVTRPGFTAGDREVTLTATLRKGNIKDTLALTVTVKEHDPINVQLLSINDLHGKIDQVYQEDTNGDGVKENIGRMDYLASYLREREAGNPNTLILHAGDAVGGSSPVSALFQDEPTIEILESIGFDVGTIGNHELDEGTAEMMRLVNGGDHAKGTANYDGINFPMIAANVKYKATGEHVLQPYAVQEVGGAKIGFVGVVTRSAAGMVMPAGIQDIEFTDETQAVNEAVAELKAQGVKAIVVMAHMDATQTGTTVTGPSATLAEQVDSEVDVILAAHNHKLVNGTVNGKLIVQSYEYGKAFADLDLQIDPVTQDIKRKQAEVVYVDQKKVSPDPAVAQILNKYGDAIKPILNRRIGETAVAMEGGYAATGDNGLGNLIADSMKWAMNSDFAMMNGGGIRDKLNAGEITWGELFNILPFNNVLVTVEILGSDLEKIVNAQLSTRYGGDFSIAGFKYKFNIATGKASNITLADGSKIDPLKTYTLATNNFMATSTSSKYLPISQSGKNMVTGPEDLEALVDYVKSYPGVLNYAPTEGRLAPLNLMTAANQAGATDKVTVGNLNAGNLIKVYANATDATVLGQGTVAAGTNSVAISGLNLNSAGGTVYASVTVTSSTGSKTESPRYPISYGAEVVQ